MSLVSSAAALLVAAILAGAGASARSPIRVCADPNNMPFSNRQRQGFENRIAGVVAHDLGRPLTYFWLPQRRGFVRNSLAAGQCDMVVGVPAGYRLTQTTRAYYRSSYAFVSRSARHLHIDSFDDARLPALTIGIQLIGNDYNNPPAAQALASRHLARNVRGFPVYGDYSKAEPQRGIVDAVARGAVDVAVVWGPVAGYFGRREHVAIDVVPVSATGDDTAPAPFAFDIAMGVRREDDALRDALDAIIVRRRGEIRQILAAYGVPLR